MTGSAVNHPPLESPRAREGAAGRCGGTCRSGRHFLLRAILFAKLRLGANAGARAGWSSSDWRVRCCGRRCGAGAVRSGEVGGAGAVRPPRATGSSTNRSAASAAGDWGHLALLAQRAPTEHQAKNRSSGGDIRGIWAAVNHPPLESPRAREACRRPLRRHLPQRPPFPFTRNSFCEIAVGGERWRAGGMELERLARTLLRSALRRRCGEERGGRRRWRGAPAASYGVIDQPIGRIRRR